MMSVATLLARPSGALILGVVGTEHLFQEGLQQAPLGGSELAGQW